MPYADSMLTIMKKLNPVGTIYMNKTDSTNPATLFGFGTWTAMADRVVVGRNPTSGTFNVAGGTTGGAETHTLTIPEMPGHTHTTATNGVPPTQVAGKVSVGTATAVDVVVSGSTGGGGAHNNLQPYVVAYMWERTA